MDFMKIAYVLCLQVNIGLSLTCYGQRTKAPSSRYYGRFVECAENVTTCVTGIGSIGQPGKEKKFEMLGRTCFSVERAKMFCGEKKNCERFLKPDGTIFKLCYYCCTSNLCNTKLPHHHIEDTIRSKNEDKKPTPTTAQTQSKKMKAILLVRGVRRRPSIVRLIETTKQSVTNTTKTHSTITTIPSKTSKTKIALTQLMQPTSKAIAAVTTTQAFIVVKDFSGNSVTDKQMKGGWISSRNISITGVSCHSDKMVAHLNATGVMENFFVTLLDAQCEYYVNIVNIVQNQIHLSIKYRSCATILETGDTHVLHTNRMVFKPRKGVENEEFSLTFACNREDAKPNIDGSVAIGSTVINKKLIPFKLKIVLYKKSTFQDTYHLNEFPIRIKASGGWAFGEVKIKSINTRDLVLGPVDCYVRDRDNETIQFKVIDNRSPVNRSVRIVKSTRMSMRFRIEMISFIRKDHQAYLYCTAQAACTKESKASSPTCGSDNKTNVKMNYYTLHSGNIHVTDTKVVRPEASAMSGDEIQRYAVLGASLGTIFLLAITCIIINKRGWSLKLNLESETGDSIDSQPERSPLNTVVAVIDAEKPGYSGGVNVNKHARQKENSNKDNRVMHFYD